MPDFLLEPRRRAERALVSVVAESYVNGVSTRKVDRLAQAMGIDRLSKSEVSEMAQSLDEMVEAFRNRGAIILQVVGAVLAEQSDEWAITRRYMSLEAITACYPDNLYSQLEEELPLAITA